MLSQLLKSANKPIIFIGSAFSDTGGTSVTSYSQSVPSGNSGDMLIFIIGSNGNTSFSTPTDWTSVVSNNRTAIFYKTATEASESSFNSGGTSTSTICGGVVLRFRNSATAPVSGTITQASVADAGTITASTVSATTGDYVLQIFVDGGSSRSYSQPSVSNGTLFTDTNSFQPSISVFYQLNASSSATSTKTGASSIANAVQVRLRK